MRATTIHAVHARLRVQRIYIILDIHPCQTGWIAGDFLQASLWRTGHAPPGQGGEQGLIGAYVAADTFQPCLTTICATNLRVRVARCEKVNR